MRSRLRFIVVAVFALLLMLAEMRLSASETFANPTSVTFSQTQPQYEMTNHYEAAVIRGDMLVVTAPKVFAKPAEYPSGGSFTLTIPSDFYVGNYIGGNYSIGVRAVSAGGAGPWALSPETSITPVPMAVTNVQIGG